MIRASGLGTRRGDHVLWADQSFIVASGEALAITGPSGAGKSTLLNCIGLVERADTGVIELDGTPTNRLSPKRKKDLFRHTIGHLFQNYALVESSSVDRNLDVALLGQGDRPAKRAAALRRVGLDGYGSRRTYSLSGGEQQRVALARLLLKKPLVVVADEPSAALDPGNVGIVLSVFAELRETGSAVVIATHDDDVAAWCGRQLCLGNNS